MDGLRCQLDVNVCNHLHMNAHQLQWLSNRVRCVHQISAMLIFQFKRFLENSLFFSIACLCTRNG
uniref:Uncharacterized protein n=1 Tax=Aegilops tauschii subsp. strangulata TaxID=200361 RepID=A0A452XGH2_AEGTS